jgi:hypothetical protein
MDITTITNAIDHEISTRSSGKFGIKVGSELYKALAAEGKIKAATFAHATGAFPEARLAYDGKYAIFEDFELGDFEYKVGVPEL